MSIQSKYANVKLIHKIFKLSYVKLIYYHFFNKNCPLRLTIKNKQIFLKNNAPISTFLLPNLSSLARLISNKWEVLSINKGYLTIKSRDNVVMTCRTDKGWDIGHLCEIYLDKAYEFNLSGKNIIDVGMSNGDSTIYFAKKGAKRVIGIEPDKRSFNLALKNIQDSKVNDKVITLNKALTTKNKKVKLFVNNSFPNANSIDLQNLVKLNDTFNEETVEGIRLKDVIDLFNGESIGLLKMDCEGAEYTILNDLDQVSYSKIDEIVMEYHNGLQNLQKILESNGFSVQVPKSNQTMGYIKAKRKNKRLSK